MSEFDFNDAARRTISDMHDEIAALRDENARLRSCLSDDADNARQVMGENAKLRELVRQAIYAKDDADWASIVSTAIELGVEVDG